MLEPITATPSNGRKRRSTRLARAVPLTVMGVDARRAPYREQVSTSTISCHGCRYESKYEVLEGDLVIVEINRPEQREPSCSVRARVKWVRRAQIAGEPFQVAAELEMPGNVWGITLPPKDWLSFPEQKARPQGTPPEPSSPLARTPQAVSISRPNGRTEPPSQAVEGHVSAPASPVMAGHAIELWKHMQVMASETVAAAAAEETNRLLEQLRAELRKEAEKTVERILASRSDEWARRSLEQMNQLHLAAVDAGHEHWREKMELDLRQASEQLAARSAELDERADDLVSRTVERLEHGLDASQRNWVKRFVAQLQQQLAPILERAQEASMKLEASRRQAEAALETHRERLEKALQPLLSKSTAHIQGMSEGLGRQFEQAARDRTRKALEEFERGASVIVQRSLEALGQASATQADKAQNCLEAALEPTLERAAFGLEQKAAEIARGFAGDLDIYARNYLECIGELIAELPKRISNRSGA